MLIKGADRGHSSNFRCVSSTIGGKKKQFGSNGIHVVWLESVKAFHEVCKETNVMQSIVGMMRIYRVEHLVK